MSPMSEQGLPAPVVAPSFGGNLPQPTTHTLSDSEVIRYRSLKRSLPESQKNLSSIANAGLRASPPPKSPRIAGGFSPIRLTGAVALADQRRQKEGTDSSRDSAPMTSENPGHKALSSLLSGGSSGSNMSKAQDTPISTTSISKPLSSIANTLSIPPIPLNPEDKPETSPASVTSLASLGSTAPTVTASSTAAVSPAALSGPSDHDSRNQRSGLVPQAQMDSGRALSYPGNMLSQQSDASKAQARNMSLPMSGLNQQLAPRSPSQKKHKCPYCETEFTRHHNLKSHLLTHSQEKPYVCQTCSMRFRRLHDLKRHTKLHTGERPHICPKCDRKFARGDALARHSKGQGGCAGRRASMGSFGGDDDYDGAHNGDGGDEGMDGIMFTDGEHTEEPLSDDDRRRFSLPSIKAQHVGNHTGSAHDAYGHLARTPSTYPPAGPRPNGPSSGGLYPPSSDRMGSSSAGTSPSMQQSIVGGHTPNTSVSSIPLSASSGGSMFGQSTMTESPKPLSPSGNHSHQLGHHDPNPINRQRSPSLTSQFQHQQYGRRQSGRNSPPSNLSLPSPHAVTHGHKLPSLSGLAPPEPRYTLPSQASAQQHSANGTSSGPPGQPLQPSNMGNHVYQHQPESRGGPGGQPHHQPSNSGDSSNNIFASGDRGVWTYIQDLEVKVKQMSEEIMGMKHSERVQEDKINRLESEVTSLRQQVNSQYGSGSSAGVGGH